MSAYHLRREDFRAGEEKTDSPPMTKLVRKEASSAEPERQDDI